MTFEEAKEKALQHNSKFNEYSEFTDGWYFTEHTDNDIPIMGGPDIGIVITNTGEKVYPYEYFLGDKYKAVLIKENIRF